MFNGVKGDVESMKGITYDDFIYWLMNQPIKQKNLVIAIVDSVIDSSEISFHNDYIVWENGIMPKTFEEFTLQLSYALDVWDYENTDEGKKYKIVSDILHDYVTNEIWLGQSKLI